jgi:prevent-host-death family protein
VKEVGASQARKHLAELLDRAAAGETITITRHGVPVAVLGPPSAIKPMSAQEAIAAGREFRKGRRVEQEAFALGPSKAGTDALNRSVVVSSSAPSPRAGPLSCAARPGPHYPRLLLLQARLPRASRLSSSLLTAAHR